MARRKRRAGGGEPEHIGKSIGRQMEMKGKGLEPDDVGKAVLAFIEADRELTESFETLKERRAQCGERVINALKKAKRTSHSIDGYTIGFKHVDERDAVTIKRPRLKED